MDCAFKEVHSSFIDNILGADLPDMQLISKFNKRFPFLLCVFDIYSENTWVVLLKNKRVLHLLMLFRKF